MYYCIMFKDIYSNATYIKISRMSRVQPDPNDKDNPDRHQDVGKVVVWGKCLGNKVRTLVAIRRIEAEVCGRIMRLKLPDLRKAAA